MTAQGEAITTTDHDSIRKWAEDRNGHPAAVAATHEEGEGGILRIAFREDGEDLEEISWEEFFKTFEDRHLAFLHQDRTKDGDLSRFFKFVGR